MNLRSIYEQLGMEAKYEKEIAKLSNRIILVVDNFNAKFYEKERPLYEIYYPKLVSEFAFLTGDSKIYTSGLWKIQELPLRDFFRRGEEKDAFQTNILHLSLLLEACKKTFPPKGYYYDLYESILSEAKRTIEITPIDIGYLFSGDTIIKKGAKELDEKLILDNFIMDPKIWTV